MRGLSKDVQKAIKRADVYFEQNPDVTLGGAEEAGV